MEKNYEDLANAIIVQAVKDYRMARHRLKHFPRDKAAQGEIRSITQFVHSGYFTLLTTLDGPSLLRKIDEECGVKNNE